MEEKDSKSIFPVETKKSTVSDTNTDIEVMNNGLHQIITSKESHNETLSGTQKVQSSINEPASIQTNSENGFSNSPRSNDGKTAAQVVIQADKKVLSSEQNSGFSSTGNSLIAETQKEISTSEGPTPSTETSNGALDNVIQSSVDVVAQQNDVRAEAKNSYDTNDEDDTKEQVYDNTSSQNVLQMLEVSVSTLLEIFSTGESSATEETLQVTELITCLKNFFTHGLKKKLCQSVMDIATQRQQQNTPIAVLTVKEFTPVLWDYLKEALDPQVILSFSGLERVRSDAGRSRAWICDVLNSKVLGQVFTSTFMEKALLEKYYEDFASVRNVESKSWLVKKMAEKLKAINFTLEVDSSRHDSHENEVSPKKEKVWHYEIHAPWPGDNQENRGDSEEPTTAGTSTNDVMNHQLTTSHSTNSSQLSSQIENLDECNSQLQQLPPQVFTQLANYDPHNQQQSAQTSQTPIIPSNQFYHPSISVAMGGHNQQVPSQLLYVEGNSQMVSVASSSHNQNDIMVEHYHQTASSHMYQMTSAGSVNSPTPGHPGVTIEGQHEQPIYTPSRYIQQFHPINVQTGGNSVNRNPSPSFMYQQRQQQTLPKIEELMAPPPSANRNNSQQRQQEYANNSGNMIHHASGPPPCTTSYYSVPHPHPAIVSQHHRPLSGPHYEPISPVIVENPQMQMYHPHQPQESNSTSAIDNALHPTDQPVEVARGEPPAKKRRPKKEKMDSDETQVSLVPIPKEDGTGSDSATEGGSSKRLGTGRGRGRPRQRPKIQGLPPPQDKEEAKEQTATFHRVYERVRRTEIKKGYDTLENLIPFHLRSDILGKKKNFSTTDVLNCARDYIEELKSDEVQHQIIITQMENERQLWKNKLRKLTMEAIKRNRILLSNESLPEFDTMEYKTSLSRFIPHVCLPNIGIQTDVFQQLPKKQHTVVTHAHLQQGVLTSGTVSEHYKPPQDVEHTQGGESTQVTDEQEGTLSNVERNHTEDPAEKGCATPTGLTPPALDQPKEQTALYAASH